MEIGNCSCQGQAEAVARRAAAAVHPDEALQHLPVHLLGNAESVVGDDADRPRRPGRRGQDNCGSRRLMVDGILDQVGKQLRQQIAVALHHEARLHICAQGSAVVLRHRRIGIAKPGDDLRKIDRAEATALLAGFDLGNTQERRSH